MKDLLLFVLVLIGIIAVVFVYEPVKLWLYGPDEDQLEPDWSIEERLPVPVTVTA